MNEYLSLRYANEIDGLVVDALKNPKGDIEDTVNAVRSRLSELCEMAVKYELVKETHCKMIMKMMEEVREL